MKMSRDDQIYYTLKFIESLRYQLRHVLENTLFDDLPILCDLDKAGLCFKCAISRMKEIFDREKAKHAK